MAVTGGSITLLTDKGQEKPVNNILHYYQSDSCHCLGNIFIFCVEFFLRAAYGQQGPIFIVLSRAASKLCSPSVLWINVDNCTRLCEIFQKTLTYSAMAKIRRMETWLARAGLLIFLLRHSWEVVVNITSRCFCRLEWTLLLSVPHSIPVLHRITLLSK